MQIVSLVPVLVIALGVFLSFRLRFFLLLHPIRVLKICFSDLKKKGEFSSLTLALAGTLGVGNVVGVSAGIILGGSGSVFWLFISSLFSSVIKYAESLLSADERYGRKGMIGVISGSFQKCGKALAGVYAFCCVLLSLFMGAALQSSAFLSCFSVATGLSKIHVSVIFIIIILPCLIFGGFIGRVTNLLIPIGFLGYLAVCLAAVIRGFPEIGRVSLQIITNAFDFSAFAGGILAILLSNQFKEGFMRGVLSNEAGLGTSSLAHSTNPNPNPCRVGAMGFFEVFFDTSVLCMLTAYAILLNLPGGEIPRDPVELVISTVVASDFALFILSASVFVFAYSTVGCWFYYGKSCFRFLLCGRRIPFAPVYLFFVFLGCTKGVGALISATDVIMTALALIIFPTMIKSSDRVCDLSEELINFNRRIQGNPKD